MSLLHLLGDLACALGLHDEATKSTQLVGNGSQRFIEQHKECRRCQRKFVYQQKIQSEKK